jgi:hypothetical protein
VAVLDRELDVVADQALEVLLRVLIDRGGRGVVL